MIPDLPGNPFAILSMIVAPAILTNASSVLAMSTSNRLARAVDRARELARQLEEATRSGDDERRLAELATTEARAFLLLRVLRSFYTALAGFALATLVSLVGAVVAAVARGPLVQALEVAGLAAGGVAVGALVHGSVLLLRETRMAVAVLRRRAETVRARLQSSRRV